jgi:hypothetical protein
MNVFRMILKINSVNQLIFVMVKCCVFFAVRTELLNNIFMSFGVTFINKQIKILSSLLSSFYYLSP